MLLYTYIRQWYEIPFITSNPQYYRKHFPVSLYVMQAICFILLMLFITKVNSQEQYSQTSAVSTKIEDKKETILTSEDLQYEKTLEKANYFYKKKRYNDAIAQYTQSLRYLSGHDKITQKHLGLMYTKIAESYKRIKNREKTAYFYKKALDVFTNLNDKKYIARTLNNLTEAERHLGHLLEAIQYSMHGLEAHEKIDDPKGLVKLLTSAGLLYQHIGRYEKALGYFNEAHLYYKKVNDVENIARTANQLGFIYTRLQKVDQARVFYQLSIDLSDANIKPKTLASAYREMAVIDLNAGKYTSAMIAAKQAYKINIKENDKSKGSLSARAIANIYLAQSDNENAITYYKDALILAIEMNNKVDQIKAQSALADALISAEPAKAISWLKKSLALAIEINNKSQTLGIYHKLWRMEEVQGNIAKSLDYAKKEIKLTKVIQNEKDDKKIMLAEANFYSQKMEVELESLRNTAILDKLELAKKNKDIEIANQTTTITELKLVKNKYASIALACLLVICLFLVLFIYRRFISSKKRNKELGYLASHDSLTNCYNRRSLFELMNRYFENPISDNDYSIIMVDIDYFKKVNDTYGHSTGDIVINGLASVLQSCVRQNDIVARFGGEEFCIVLHSISQYKAMNIAEAMRSKIESSIFNDVTVTSSFGVASLPCNAMTPEELIERADLALYKSKSLGRNQVTLWDESFKK